ncbi:MOSC domain-containing protein [Nocardioides solisilvae]|uniref:MOSC domain-containing protein n=1 Tax=Nocardioides solisilvae TaxID=1542435 RepID=UPI000D747B02|nr:MOSC domain-containing protein [Nocardioides solisilvae]
MSAQVIAVNVGRPEGGPWTGRVGRTAIRKHPQAGPVGVRRTGLDGDSVCDLTFHGGPDRAVYAFAREDLDHWQSVLDRPLRDGLFGENLTTSGLEVTEARLGERWRVGTALVEVASVRTACRVFTSWLGRHGLEEGGWVRRFTEHGHPGAYLRVLEEGVVERGDAVEVVHRPAHDVTVGLAFRAVTTERALLPRLLEVDGLAEHLREKAEAYAASAARR